jgi:predicted nucleic acid binding AN1-type Zn finger protein
MVDCKHVEFCGVCSGSLCYHCVQQCDQCNEIFCGMHLDPEDHNCKTEKEGEEK